MSEPNTITRAKREVVQRTKTTKKRGISSAGTKLTQRQRGLALSKQPGYQVPIRRKNAAIALLVAPSLRNDLNSISDKTDVSVNKIAGIVLGVFVEEYKRNPAILDDIAALKIETIVEKLKDHKAKREALSQLATAFQVSIK